MRLRTLKYNISEGFHVSRWILAVVVIAFCSVVSLYRFIEMSGITDITYSSLETTYQVLNDTVNKVYVYLPLYAFIICGIVFDDNFGAIEILKSGSRRSWLWAKIVTLMVYTVVFFTLLLFLNFTICSRVFPYSEYWSADFIRTMVLQGDNVLNYVHSPLVTIGAYIIFYFFLYLVIGMISISVSLATDREELALFLSMGTGILVNILLSGKLAYQNLDQTKWFLLITGIVLLAIIIFSEIYLRKMDFSLKKKLS